MEQTLVYASAGTFAGTLFSMFLINYNPSPVLLILLPMWGLVFGISLAKVIQLESKPKRRR